MVLVPNFSEPVVAGRSFLAALACDQASAEYRCLGESLKARYGADLALYLLGRDALREELGSSLKYAFQLQPVGENQIREDGVLVWWGLSEKPLVGFLMEAQFFYNLLDLDGQPIGEFLPRPPASWMHLEDGRRLLVEIPLSRSVQRRLGGLENAGGLQLGTEWKVRDVLRPGPDGPESVAAP